MPSAPYYRYDDPSGSALNNVAAEPAAYDELINRPRVYTYKPSYSAPSYPQQNLTYPAPVYYASQPQQQAPMAYYLSPTPSQPSYCYISNPPSYYSLHRSAYAAPPDTPMGYYYSQPFNSAQTNQHTPSAPAPQAQPAPQYYYYPPQAPASGQHHPGYPYPGQAASSGPTTLADGTTLFVGKTKEQVHWENQQIANNTGANEVHQMVPYKAAPGQQFWCRELDGSWTLRTVNEAMNELQPGYWDKSQSGHAVFIRQKP